MKISDACELSADGKRAITPVGFGIACYEGACRSVDDQHDQFTGRRVGLCEHLSDARVWLGGGAPDSFISMEPPKTLGNGRQVCMCGSERKPYQRFGEATYYCGRCSFVIPGLKYSR